MAAINKKQLILDMETDVNRSLQQLEVLQDLQDEVLLRQPEPGKWSVLQVLAHLNGYNEFYLPVFEKAINSKRLSVATSHKPGWLGDYFTKLMQPKDDGTLAKKMSAPKDYTYTPELDREKVMNEFRDGQRQLLLLLDKAQNADLNVRIPISISKWVTLKLGDGFRFLIAHQVRHFLQINHISKQLANSFAA